MSFAGNSRRASSKSAFVPAILNDIAGPPEKPALAQELDAKHFKGLLPYGTYVARTIFIHTLAFNNDLKGLSARPPPLLDPKPRGGPVFH